MVSRKLYLTYSVVAKHGPAIGRNTFTVERDAYSDLLSFSEIERIEAMQLEHLRTEYPDVERVFLTNWIWLAPDPASPAPTERSGTP